MTLRVCQYCGLAYEPAMHHDCPRKKQTMSDERTQLLPCPFCGGEAEIEREGTPRRSTIYRCTECGCGLETGETFGHGSSWNVRPAEDRLSTTLAAAERERDANHARWQDAERQIVRIAEQFTSQEASLAVLREALTRIRERPYDEADGIAKNALSTLPANASALLGCEGRLKQLVAALNAAGKHSGENYTGDCAVCRAIRQSEAALARLTAEREVKL